MGRQKGRGEKRERNESTGKVEGTPAFFARIDLLLPIFSQTDFGEETHNGGLNSYVT